MSQNKDEQTPFEVISADLLKRMTATDINKRIKASVQYFASKNDAKFVDNSRPNISLLTKGRAGASDIRPGQIFTFSYHAKHADTLAYWDRFPMMIFLDINKHSHLLGLNLHYLPPPVRAKILGSLVSVITAKKLRHDTKLKITYAMVKSIKEYKPLQFAIKSYIPANIAGKMVRMQPSSWNHAIFFPSELFVGASTRQVWADSKRFK